MNGRRRFSLFLSIFGLSCAILLLEVSYTRVYSWKLYYYYSFFVLGLALFGLAVGSALITRFPGWVEGSLDRTLAVSGLGGSLAVGLGYWVIVYLPTDTTVFLSSATELSKLGMLIVVVFVPFVLAGLGVAAILASRPGEIHTLYFFDLLGAGLAAALAVVLINRLTPPGVVFVAAAMLGLVGAAWVLRVEGVGWFAAALGLVGLLLAGGLFAERFPTPIPDRVKFGLRGHELHGAAIHTDWNAIYRIDVLDRLRIRPGAPDLDKKPIFHEGVHSSAFWPSDGTRASLRLMDDQWDLAVPFGALSGDSSALIIGAAGGREVLGSLYHGAKHVTGVELNPAYREMLTGRFAEFTGRFVEDPRVDYRIAEGRAYLARTDRRYDLIYFVSPDSYASREVARSGAFVLHEGYLYTEETVRIVLDRLRPSGVMAVQLPEFRFNRLPFRAPRYLMTVRRALQARGVEEPARHVVLLRSPGWGLGWALMVLVKKRPFTAGEVEAIRGEVGRFEEVTMYGPGDFPADHDVFRPLTLSGEKLSEWVEGYPYNLRPVRDDSPYFWNIVNFSDLVRSGFDLPGKGIRGKGELVLLVLLGAGALLGLALALAFLPGFLASGLAPWDKGWITLYFALIGTAFMGLEVALIQKFTLFLGYPTYSLTICLATILVATGVGSLVSEDLAEARRGPLVGLLVVVVGTLGILYGFPVLKANWMGAGMGVKAFLTVGVLVPLGLGMGMFLPAGMDWLARRSPDPTRTVAWSWAVNGFFSVLASVIGTILAMAYGFNTVLLVGLALYLGATGCFLLLSSAPLSR